MASGLNNIKRTAMKHFKLVGFIVLVLLLTVPVEAKSQSFPIDSSYTIKNQYQKYVKKYPYIIPVKDACPVGVVDYREQVYATLENTRFGRRELHADVFVPEKDGKFPAVLLIHGGAWQSGNKSHMVPLGQLLANKGYVTVAVEYQLGLEAPYPAAVHNIKAAIRWLRANSDTYQVDTGKVVIAGASSGGHLAALVGLTNGVEKMEGNQGNPDQSSRVHAIMDMDGVLSFLAAIMLNAERSPGSPDINWIGGTYTEKPALWKEISPLYWANETSVPILFLGSGYPRFLAGMDELTGRYRHWGLYYEYHNFNVEMHTFWLFHPYVDKTVGHMVNFMNRVW